MALSLTNYPAIIHTLNPVEQKLLQYCAYTAKPIGDKQVAPFSKLAECTEKETKSAKKKLMDLGMLVSRRPNYYESSNTYINSKWQVLGICHLIQFGGKWQNKLKHVSRGMNDLALITDHFVTSILGIDKGLDIQLHTSSPWRSEKEYAEALLPVAFEPAFETIIAHLDDVTLQIMIDGLATQAITYGNIDFIGFVMKLYTNNRALIRTAPDYMAQAQFAYYLYHGEMCMDKDVLKVTPEMTILQIEGFKKAYQGDTEGALALLDKALKLSNRTAPTQLKNLFRNSISNFLLYVLYAKEGSAANLKKLDQGTRKKALLDIPAYRTSYFLAEYFKDEERKVSSSSLLYYLCEKHKDAVLSSTYVNQLSFLFAMYAGLTEKDFRSNYRKPDLTPSLYIPTIPLLCHELSPYLPLNDEVKTSLRNMFGGEPLLHSIRRKEKWELVLESMLPEKTSEPSDNKKAAVKKERVVYVFNRVKSYYSDDSIELEVRLQTRLKNGEWGAGKKMSYSSYQEGNFEMDEKDRIIWQNNNGHYYTPSLEAAIPHLVGQDKLLYDGHGYNREPVKVVEVKPFLVVKRDKKFITVDSNLPGGVDLDRKVIFDFDVKNLVLTYFPVTQQQCQYFKQFRALGKMPLEAEALLKRVFPNISDTVEIHSDFIEGGTKLKEVDGQTKVCMRIVPNQGNFNMGLSITPLEGGKQSLVPGQGNRIIYDEVEGERCQVKRVLSQETNNGSLFMEFLGDLGVDTEEWTALLTAEDLLELLDFAREHQEEGYIEWPEGERVRLKTADPSTWNISLKKNGGWFDLEGEVPIDENTVLSIGQLMEMMQGTRSRFVRVGEEQYISLSESLRKQLMRLESLSSSMRGKARIPAVGMALMGEALKGEMPIKHSKETAELTNRIRKSAKLQPEVPDTLNATLRDYQVDGFNWMSRLDSWGAGSCLADDMGLGKTIQTISFLLSKASEGPALVVAPASVVPNWQKELARFAPTLACSILNEAEDREALIREAREGQVVLSTYGLLVTQQETLVEKQWSTICLDEAHTIKNRDTKTSAVCMKLQSQHRIILTGTPIQNHLGELWNLFQFINPGLLGSYENFSKKFIVPIEGNGDGDRRQQLKRIIAPFMLRRTKQEVVEELPDKQDITISVELSKEEMGVYEVLRRKAQKELEEIQLQGSNLNVNALAEITKLRMCACSVSLAEKSWPGMSSKIESFLDLAQELAEGGNRALVFSQFTSFLDQVKDALDKSPNHKNIKYFYLDGSTPMRQRSKMVEAFQKGECQLFLISLKAGGLGLNLTGANYVIHLDPWWNPAIEQQATDRAHRIGQQQKVTVYHLVSQHTIEEKILRLHETKRNLAESLLEGSNQSHKITVDQLLGLITQ